MSDLNEIKAGDYVALYHRGQPRKVKVDRITNTQVIIGGDRYSKKSQYKVGDTGGGWRSRSYIAPLSEVVEQEIAEYQLKVKKGNLADKINYDVLIKLSLETLQQIMALIEQKKAEK